MSFEKTTPELIFELGNGAQMLTLTTILGRNINEAPFDLVKRNYDEFKARAISVGVWPELPELTEYTLSSQFLAAQVDAVLRHIKLNKTGSMEQLFYAGKAAELIELSQCINFN